MATEIPRVKKPMNRTAIFIPASGVPELITQSASYVPTGTQVLVRVKYSAVNPADLRHFYMGMHSYVAGYEWLGVVEAAGPHASFAVGDTLFGLTEISHRRPVELGAHQDLLLTETGPGTATYKVPDGVERNDEWLRQLVAWPVAFMAASDALLHNLFQMLIYDDQWGGSSAVGLSAIYLASKAGFGPIYTTASPKNHEALLALGATRCFDYRSPTVVDEIRAAVATESGRKLAVVFDAVATGTGFGEPAKEGVAINLEKSSPALAARCVSDGVAKFCATLPLPHDPRWTFCLSRRGPEESEYDRRNEASVAWALDQLASSGSSFRMPKINVVKGAEAGIQAIHDVFEGRISMEKYVIEHPM
ncbi:hypothetical protein FHL15_007955 [Xylaria flabelliformis]|uniref:Enoyl reductase (ER) domain-containing protein n=1 Tax=Xylaria flabelliformis TaxID=2512241 RepID=A0A553HTB1_9PEZI|nr:hypothetical protein FHL15_007955 [Xylaria flabelliformis]